MVLKLVWIANNSVALTPLKHSTPSNAVSQPIDPRRASHAGLARVSISPVLFWIERDGEPDMRICPQHDLMSRCTKTYSRSVQVLVGREVSETDQSGSSRLTSDSHLGSVPSTQMRLAHLGTIPSEAIDVVLDPLQGELYIQQTQVGQTLFSKAGFESVLQTE